MDWLIKMLTNPFAVTALSSWFLAQLIKVIINLIIQRKLILERLFGDGGMPSGHSATVSSLATIIGLMCGFDSAIFAVAGILAVIVCHDATGVRQQAGKHAEMLNEIIELLGNEELPREKFKVLLGHTPLQVIAGITIGIANALLMYFLVFSK